jgi:sugar/nucleoside kinase (ribokinase family)
MPAKLVRFLPVRPLGVIGHLSRDIVGDAAPQIGGGPWHAARALRALRHEALVFAKCGDRALGRQLATLGLPTSVTLRGETTAFSFSYDAAGVRTMAVDAIGEPWSVRDLPQNLLRRVGWVQVAPLLHGDFDDDALAWLARDRRLLFDGQGLVRRRQLGALQLDGTLDRSALRHVSILKLAVEEAAVLGDVRELGVPEVLITHGAAGADVITPDGAENVPARSVARDPTGAGDAFGAAYLVSRAQGHTPVSAARRATALVAGLLMGRLR